MVRRIRWRKLIETSCSNPANFAIGSALTQLAESQDFNIRIPPARLCTDNAAMIAWAGLERFAGGAADPIGFSPKARWPLDSGSGESDQRQGAA